MTIREYANLRQVEVKGRLTRVPEHDGRDWDGTPFRFYVDDAGNEYTINRNGICIVTVDGDVI